MECADGWPAADAVLGKADEQLTKTGHTNKVPENGKYFHTVKRVFMATWEK
jgi:hypothetical protein